MGREKLNERNRKPVRRNMSRTPRTESKIQVKVIDVSAMEKEAYDNMQAKEFNKDLETMTIVNKWGYVETPRGIFLLCDEGVGDKNPVSAEHPAEFYFSRNWNRGGAKSMELVPCIGYKVSAEEVKQQPVKEVVTLDKFIRTFGSRLEVNYETWQAVLSKEMKKKPIKA